MPSPGTPGITQVEPVQTFVRYRRLSPDVYRDITTSNPVQEDATIFNTRFARCRGLLHFIACRVLGGTEGARDSVQNCWFTASRNPSKFEHEGAFRSWLLRIVIDEALAIRRKKRESISG
jgi:DNA-directed RNA polymerase specialized sigma24 family protein